jgi:hypothetical protein
MQAKKLITALAIAGAAVISTAPVAAAADGDRGHVTVDPHSARPGESVTVDDGGRCWGRSEAWSDAFTSRLRLDRDGGRARARIADVDSGDYDVWVSCETGRRWKHKKRICRGSVHVMPKPVGPVKTGFGGAVRSASTAEMAGGAALLASAGAAIGAVALRRRRDDAV